MGNVSTIIKHIYVYLKPRRVDTTIELRTYISFNGRHELTSEEWNSIFVEKADLIRNFFLNPSNSSPLKITCDRLHVHMAPQPTSQMLLLLNDNNPEASYPMVINELEWFNIERVMECINSRIKHLNKLRSTYENRINFLKKHLKIHRPSNMQDAHQIIDRLCNKDDVVDSEIKCYTFDFLCNVSLL